MAVIIRAAVGILNWNSPDQKALHLRKREVMASAFVSNSF